MAQEDARVRMGNQLERTGARRTAEGRILGLRAPLSARRKNYITNG
jgi:hypothetical protein